MHVTDGLAGWDADQGDACPAIDPERLYGWELEVEYAYPTRSVDSVERAPMYRGTLHDGGEVVVTAEWRPTDGVGAEVGGELEVTVAGETASILASIPMAGNALVAFDPPLVCSSQLGGAVIAPYVLGESFRFHRGFRPRTAPAPQSPASPRASLVPAGCAPGPHRSRRSKTDLGGQTLPSPLAGRRADAHGHARARRAYRGRTA